MLKVFIANLPLEGAYYDIVEGWPAEHEVRPKLDHIRPGTLKGRAKNVEEITLLTMAAKEPTKSLGVLLPPVSS